MYTTSLLNSIGSTPMVDVGLSGPGHCFAKAEYLNPGGSIKDRIALFIIEEAERRGDLQKGMTIAEATSGNTGIAVAMIGLIKGYPVKIIMPENMSEERKQLIRALNADLILTPKEESVGGAVNKLNEICSSGDSVFVPNQFENQDNSRAHYLSTGPEIWEAMDGRVDVFVSGIGSGGTIMGTGTFLKEMNPNLKVIAVEPKDVSAILGHQPGLHKIEGIGDGFIPEIVDLNLIDDLFEVSDEDAIETAKGLAARCGYLTGISSGANIHAAMAAKRHYGPQTRVATILADGAERYFSTGLFQQA
ncbi:MAG: cysteine synthase family protein [Desulfobacterales bacterium]|nr:cysteine synthase family protein [Desulfobacterales bacterium]